MSHIVLLLATLALYQLALIESRTCICAEFLDYRCDKVENCQWRSVNDPQTGAYLKGICRSEKWLACQADPDCTEKVGIYGAGGDRTSALLRGYETDSVPSENDDPDWPWNCHTGEYAKYPINVRAFDLATLELAALNPVSNQEMESNVVQTKGVTSNAVSFNGNVSVVAVASFLVLLIGGLLYYKFGKKEKNVYDTLLDNEHTPFRKIYL
mmetsp:Transcript_9492/g.15279  ORF Transcript_9492/g.15279 Transcript_9492/m.15279 type:complete len:211 (-) Transcript_9492:220-852(-)